MRPNPEYCVRLKGSVHSHTYGTLFSVTSLFARPGLHAHMKKRIKASFSDKPAPATKTPDPIELNDPVNDPFGEKKRSVIRYRESLDELKEALKLVHRQWKAFQFSEPEEITDDRDPSRLRQAINDVFESAQGMVK